MYRVSFYYTDHHKTIVSLDSVQLFHLDNALKAGDPTFHIVDFGKEGNSLYVNLEKVRFTVVQSSEGTLLELPGVPESDTQEEADAFLGIS